ncbi:hypothetical protein FJ987_17315 [Mesorhizobium sp. CU2]|uniref:hypothetical protein n=1 Tax=unclassified Mesorhizobium TaxID=325217 RepID=UPI00112BBBE7|nr:MULTISPECIES: hypothetical protein [unclassified Mesorhizobium]TPN83208.1 hypothetical protein FJ988_14470 [Mesorhizobium sp. CU3]TPO12220.1 hypothetical protein FJ987_17315 [Mesorhizobium sp. CU2]
MSGIMGIHHDNMPALHDAYSQMLAEHEIAKIDAAEQFCIGIAVSKAASISPHHMRIGDYNTRGKKAFAGPRVLQFFKDNGSAPITDQIKRAGRYRLWRTPLEIWRQKMVNHLR